MPTNKEYRQAIIVAMRQHAAEAGDLESYMARAYVEYYFIDRAGFEWDDQLLAFQIAHNTLKQAMVRHPFSRVLRAAHDLCHDAMDQIIAEAEAAEVSLDTKDPLLEGRQSEFEAWQKELDEFIKNGGAEDG